jgi:hypothetical protein
MDGQSVVFLDVTKVNGVCVPELAEKRGTKRSGQVLGDVGLDNDAMSGLIIYPDHILKLCRLCL